MFIKLRNLNTIIYSLTFLNIFEIRWTIDIFIFIRPDYERNILIFKIQIN